MGLAMPLSSVLAKKAYVGRDVLYDGFVKYFEANGQEYGSKTIQVRFKGHMAAGAELRDNARYEIAMPFVSPPTWLSIVLTKEGFACQ